MSDAKKKCGKCGQTKAESEFYKRAGYPGKLLAWCKECCKIAAKAARANA
jgi:hypothetical protein